MASMYFIAIAAAVSLLSIYPPSLPNLVGRAHIDANKLLKWQHSSPINNKHCIVSRTANACEDVAIHYPSGTAFLACGDPLERTRWYPPSGPKDAGARSEASFREFLFSYDIVKGTTTQLKIEGLEGDFVTHGLDVYQGPDKSVVHVFAVRHARDGDSIAVFSHQLGSDTVRLVKNVRHAAIRNANAVVAVGDLKFYLTNDHYFVNGPLRYLEERLGPWNWATDVQYCDASQDVVHCKKVAGPFPGANGIAIRQDRLFVGDSTNGTLNIYKIRPDDGLDFQRQIELGAGGDNIKIVPTTGDVIVTVFPTLLDLPKYLGNIHALGKEHLIPSAALRISSRNDYGDEPELIFMDAGSVLSFMTAMAFDPYNGVAIGAAVLQYGGFAVCKISDEVMRSFR